MSALTLKTSVTLAGDVFGRETIATLEIRSPLSAQLQAYNAGIQFEEPPRLLDPSPEEIFDSIRL